MNSRPRCDDCHRVLTESARERGEWHSYTYVTSYAEREGFAHRVRCEGMTMRQITAAVRELQQAGEL